jgi:hypothetical protein
MHKDFLFFAFHYEFFLGVPLCLGDFVSTKGFSSALLADLLLRTQFSWSEKISTTLWVHHFDLQQRLNDENELGQEIDAVTVWQYNKHVAFELGASAFVPGLVMRQRFGSSDVSLWCYLTFIFNHRTARSWRNHQNTDGTT